MQKLPILGLSPFPSGVPDQQSGSTAPSLAQPTELCAARGWHYWPYDCSVKFPSCLPVKFTDATVVVGCIINPSASEYREEYRTSGVLVQKQHLHQCEEDQGDVGTLKEKQTPLFPSAHRRSSSGSGFQILRTLKSTFPRTSPGAKTLPVYRSRLTNVSTSSNSCDVLD